MPTPNGYEDITPEDSVVPVYLVPELVTPIFDKPEFSTPDEMIAAQQAQKDMALNKLKKLGLTESEAKAVIGL